MCYVRIGFRMVRTVILPFRDLPPPLPWLVGPTKFDFAKGTYRVTSPSNIAVHEVLVSDTIEESCSYTFNVYWVTVVWLLSCVIIITV